MKKLRIGLDWDDVIAPFNSLAIDMANEKYAPDPLLSINELTTWENRGRTSVIKEFYGNAELYRRQTEAVSEKNKAAVRSLMAFADVYVISAVYPEWMTVRSSQVLEVFPELTPDRIILGAAKDLVHFDFLLDDNINNVLSSPADYPVLFRKPWNTEMTGLLSVNTLEEFVCLVQGIAFPESKGKLDIKIPSVVALVGPSGSGKNDVAHELALKDGRFVRPMGYTTNLADPLRIRLSEEEFEKEAFFEKTRYAGHAYGMKEEDIAALLKEGNFPVVPIDICGAIGMKLHFPTVIIYLRRGKEKIIADIIADNSLNDREKTLRILSLDAERKNEDVCDISFESGEAVEGILTLFQ